MKEFNNNTDLVITAYNGGSGNVKEWLNDKELSHSGEYLDKIPFKETERFLDRVKNYHSMYRRLYEKDFK
jgi:soluble lytic murein transglycosylase